MIGNNKPIPVPTVERLCRMRGLCDELSAGGRAAISSRELAVFLGVSAEVVRKDIAHIGDAGRVGFGYETQKLGQRIAMALGLQQERPACVVGLGRLGSALLEYEGLARGGIRVVAGFDSSINRLETIRTSVPVYPAHELSEVVARRQVAVGLLAVPARAAQKSAEALAAGGVSGILNFAPVVVTLDDARVAVRNVDMVNELRVIAALGARGRR